MATKDLAAHDAADRDALEAEERNLTQLIRVAVPERSVRCARSASSGAVS
jgi:hypothetical protein